MDVYEAIEAVTKGQKVRALDMRTGVYWFLKDDVIYHRHMYGSEAGATPAKIAMFMDDTFELITNSLSVKVWCVSDRAPAHVEVIEVKDLIPKIKELMEFLSKYSEPDGTIASASVCIKIDELLGEKLSKKVGE